MVAVSFNNTIHGKTFAVEYIMKTKNVVLQCFPIYIAIGILAIALCGQHLLIAEYQCGVR